MVSFTSPYQIIFLQKTKKLRLLATGTAPSFFWNSRVSGITLWIWDINRNFIILGGWEFLEGLLGVVELFYSLHSSLFAFKRHQIELFLKKLVKNLAISWFFYAKCKALKKWHFHHNIWLGCTSQTINWKFEFVFVLKIRLSPAVVWELVVINKRQLLV